MTHAAPLLKFFGTDTVTPKQRKTFPKTNEQQKALKPLGYRR